MDLSALSFGQETGHSSISDDKCPVHIRTFEDLSDYCGFNWNPDEQTITVLNNASWLADKIIELPGYISGYKVIDAREQQTTAQKPPVSLSKASTTLNISTLGQLEGIFEIYSAGHYASVTIGRIKPEVLEGIEHLTIQRITDESGMPVNLMFHEGTWGIFHPTDYENTFKLKSIKFCTDCKVSVAHIKSMQSMFAGLDSLEEVDLSGIDFSKAGQLANMSSMFMSCRNLRKVKIGDEFEHMLSAEPTEYYSDILSLDRMFADCPNLEELQLQVFNKIHFNPEIEVSYDGIFDGCRKLETVKTTNTDILGEYETIRLKYSAESALFHENN